MLKEFIDGQRASTPPSNLNEYVQRMVSVFDSCVDFLRDNQRFPNREINQVVTLMWRLIANKEIPVALDQWGFPAMTFAVLGKDIEQIPIFIMPGDFITQVSEDPVFQLGLIAYMASQARDFYTGRITSRSSDKVNRRARGYEAEALLTLQEMAREEGVDLNFHDFQLEILTENPQGLTSLPKGYVYQTPVYTRPIRG